MLFIGCRTETCRLNGVLRDEGGLLPDIDRPPTPPLPIGVEQKVTSEGTSTGSRFQSALINSVVGNKYLALQVSSEQADCKATEHAPALRYIFTPYPTESFLTGHSPSIMDSRVSISFADAVSSTEIYDEWLYCIGNDESISNRKTVTPNWDSHFNQSDEHEATVRAVVHSSSPVRPRASNPPTPDPDSAVSMAESYRSGLAEHPAKRSLDVTRALSSHPIDAGTSSSLPLPKVSLPHEEFPVKHPSPEKGVEIKHPSPRRFASHPVLLQRASSLASSLYPRSMSDSPGPPPPRSPLRLRRDPRTIEGILAPVADRKSTPKLAPSIRGVNEHKVEVVPIKPTVTTDCTGPIKRPRSRGKTSVPHPAYPSSRKEREERIRARKLRDRPAPARTIDAVVNTSPGPVRHRLRKARPHIQIPDLRPAPLATRASSSASSTASWKKITEDTRTPVSAVPSENTPTSTGDKTGYTPVSPTTSNRSSSAKASMAFSPVMLVAEEIPVPKAKSPLVPAKLIVKEGKSYTPRPRSASIPRTALKRRSRQGTQNPSRQCSPGAEQKDEKTPPLPSSPPNRALPPTPPASGSEKRSKARSAQAHEWKKELPTLPTPETIGKRTSPPKRTDPLPHVAQVQRKSASSKESTSTSRIHARLEALEKQNALLSAALTAVLRTNGASNAPLSSSADVESPKSATAWEARIARRSAASHAGSSSNGSALDMYMNTKLGSRRGR